MSRESVKAKLIKAAMPVLVLGIGVAAGAAVYTSKPPVEEEPPVVKPRSVNTMAVESSSVSLQVASQGTVEPMQKVNLVPQVNGQIIYVAEQFVNGGVFAEGDTILEIDPRDYELALITAEAQVADARQLLETARAQSEQAVSEWNLLDRGKPTELALRKPQLAHAQARLKSAEAELLKAQLMLERTRITAPFAGIITAKEVDRGQYVSAGTQLAEISSSENLEIRLSLPERDVEKLDLARLRHHGLRVRLNAISGDQTHSWTGTIVREEGRIDQKTRNRVLVARLHGPQLLSANGSRISIGQFVRAQIEGRDVNRVYELPRVALHNGDSVYVVDHENRLRERKVTVLDVADDTILVADGINDGEVVTVSPMTSGVEGTAVVSLNRTESES